MCSDDRCRATSEVKERGVSEFADLEELCMDEMTGPRNGTESDEQELL